MRTHLGGGGGGLHTLTYTDQGLTGAEGEGGHIDLDFLSKPIYTLQKYTRLLQYDSSQGAQFSNFTHDYNIRIIHVKGPPP